jgi:hypothetical protein
MRNPNCLWLWLISLASALFIVPAHSLGQQPRWIAITAPALTDAMAPLVQRRKSEGFEVVTYTVQRDDTAETLQMWLRAQQGDSDGEVFVVLAGDWFPENLDVYVPPGQGQHGRMQGQISDACYGLPDEAGAASMAVGRLPARTADELKGIVAKIIRFEDQRIGPWSNRVCLWVGHPGGNSPIEKKFGEAVIHATIGAKLQAIPDRWYVECAADFPDTPYTIPHEEFSERLETQLRSGQCFSVYAGHSAAMGCWSTGQFIVEREFFEKVKIENSPGVFVTTGCYACQLAGPDGQGYLVAAMRNADGPVACIGAYGESYAAHGQLVMDAFVEALKANDPASQRLAFGWLAAQRGIARGPLSPLTFWLYDQADGSRGRVPLAAQRLEHAQMWTLLGDPALKIPRHEPGQ